jgi:CheY-like chemotaxis protein
MRVEYSTLGRGIVMTKEATVLVVEDNAIIRQIALLNLRRLGIHADTANNGEEAVQKFKLNDYDLILMDVAMPIMNGIDATEIIRDLEQAKGKRIPIIGVTASETRERCLSAGMDDYIIKPPDYQRILRKWLPQAFPERHVS